MNEECADTCMAHTGQDERINGVGGKLSIVIWLLGILIVLFVSMGGWLFSSIQSLNISMAGTAGKFGTIEAKIQTIEATESRFGERLERIERKIPDK